MNLALRRGPTICVVLGLSAAACAGSAPASAPLVDASMIVSAVRATIAGGDIAAGERLLAAHEAEYGVSPQMLLALSWIGRGALASVRLTDAERLARRTYAQGTELLRSRGMDDEADLPIAMGAAIEVLAQVGVRRGRRSEAVLYLEGELRKFTGTSIPKRIQKNIHLINLEGQPVLEVTSAEWIGDQRLDAEALRGNVQVLFFWAHWCSDCKAQGPVLAQLLERYRKDGLRIVAPTQRFGYVAGGEPAPPDVERAYIEMVRDAWYPWLSDVPVPLDEANHLSFGVSTTPTLVVVDRQGLIRAYHPGQMTEGDLDALLRPLLLDVADETGEGS